MTDFILTIRPRLSPCLATLASVLALAACSGSNTSVSPSEADTLALIRERGELVVLTLAGPTSYMDDAGGISGYEVDLATAFADELAVIMEWAFGHLQRSDRGTPDPRTALDDGAGGSVYLRLSTNPVEQPHARSGEAWRQGVIDGAYWLRPPGPNAEIVIAYQGVIAPEAIKAAGALAGLRRDIGVLAITSADRLHAGWAAAQRQRDEGHAADCVAETLLSAVPRHCRLVTVIDGHPASLSWLGAVAGHRVLPLGVERFGQTGTIGDLYHHFGIDAAAIVQAAIGLTDGHRGMPRLVTR